MPWPLPLSLPMPKRTWVLGGGIAFVVSLVCLLTFHHTSKADSTRMAPPPAAPVAHGPVWVPEVVTAPGLPLQCADGTWTRTVVRGGCAHHGGVVY
jgi:hypothetical protein